MVTGFSGQSAWRVDSSVLQPVLYKGERHLRVIFGTPKDSPEVLPRIDVRRPRSALRGRADAALRYARLGVLRCDGAAWATEVLAGGDSRPRAHPGVAVLPVEGCTLAVVGIDHTPGSACLRPWLPPRSARTFSGERARSLLRPRTIAGPAVGNAEHPAEARAYPGAPRHEAPRSRGDLARLGTRPQRDRSCPAGAAASPRQTPGAGTARPRRTTARGEMTARPQCDHSRPDLVGK
jgi:hypothetical protein